MENKYKEKRIGEKHTNKWGYKYEIIDYINDGNVVIKFEDGTIKHTKMNAIRLESVLHPSLPRIPKDEYEKRMNEVIYFQNGHTLRIKEYRRTNDIDVIFDDGMIVHCSYSDFHKGKVSHPIEGKSKKNIYDRISDRLYNAYKHSAEIRNIDLELTKEDFRNMIFEPCFYCGHKGDNNYSHQKHLGILHNGIDRINSSIGYTKNNIVTCCKRCNFSKRDLSYQDWINYLNRISSYYTSYREEIINKIERLSNVNKEGEK